MKRIVALAAVAALALGIALWAAPAASTSTTFGNLHHHHPPPARCTAKAFRPFSRSVWRLPNWERGAPPVEVIQAQRRRLRCAGPGNRKAMQKRWSQDHRLYVHYRRRQLAAQDEIQSTIDAVGMGTLEAIAACESGGSPTAVSASGTYRGKYQFDYGTWASVGGSGDPAAAPEAEQDYRAALLYLRSGSAPWPVCG